MTATRVIDGIIQVQPAPRDRWQNAPDKLQRAFMAASALTREEFNLVFCPTFTMDTMKPRIIHTKSGTINASEVAFIEQIEERCTGEFQFFIGSNNHVFVFESRNRSELEQARRRLIGFIWPNADVFDPSKNNTTS